MLVSWKVRKVFNTFTSHIKSQLTNAGFSVIKDFKEKQWIVLDGNKEIMYNSSLGQLMSKAAKEFGINNWEQ